MITVSEDNLKVMEFLEGFSEFAKRQGIRDPFKVSQDLFSKHCYYDEEGLLRVDLDKGFDEPTQAEKDAWIKMRDEYVARRCFYEIGYESFFIRTEPHNYECDYDISYMRELEEFVPCKSADHQCTFDCVKFVECVLNGTWSPD